MSRRCVELDDHLVSIAAGAGPENATYNLSTIYKVIITPDTFLHTTAHRLLCPNTRRAHSSFHRDRESSTNSLTNNLRRSEWYTLQDRQLLLQTARYNEQRKKLRGITTAALSPCAMWLSTIFISHLASWYEKWYFQVSSSYTVAHTPVSFQY